MAKRASAFLAARHTKAESNPKTLGDSMLRGQTRARTPHRTHIMLKTYVYTCTNVARAYVLLSAYCDAATYAWVGAWRREANHCNNRGRHNKVERARSYICVPEAAVDRIGILLMGHCRRGPDVAQIHGEI